jgi:hypothetical protein
MTARAQLFLQQKECIARMEHALAKANAIDGLFFLGWRLAIAAEDRFVRLYLFIRFRHLSGPLLRRKLESLRTPRATPKSAKSPVVSGAREEVPY